MPAISAARCRRGGGTVKVASQNEVAADFAAYVKAAKKGPVVITNRGKPLAVLLRSESEDDLERLLVGHSRKLQSILEAARRRFRQARGIPHETFWKEVEAVSAGKSKKRTRTGRNSRSDG
jgi:prevent-host-death family protein